MKSQKLFFLALGILLSWTSSFAQNEAQIGEWSNPIPFGIVPVAVANLPDGRLLCWSSQFRNTFITSGDGATFTEIFDPFQGSDGLALGEFTSNTNHDMFCPGINNLADGRILAAGGTSSEKTSIYDWQTGLWSVADEMNIPRGYQGNVTLSDGSVFTVGGSWSGGAWTNRDAEIWTESSGWQLLPNIKGDDFYTANDVAGDSFQSLYRVDNHIWLWVAPDGNLFHPGPSEQMHWVNTNGNGSMVSAGFRSTDGFSMKGTTVMFDIGKILKVGGAESYDDRDPANDNSYVIDINGGYGSTPTVTPTSNKIQFSRTMHNSTVLPNGEVLITGGLSESLVFTDGGARLTAEIFNPTTNSWRSVAGMQTPRTYHSVAILMIDGRVFVGGGGLCPTPPQAGCVDHFDAEIYSPPYLFDGSGNLASRPVITAPDFAGYNSTIGVTGTSGIQEFSLIRFSAATHSTNNEQRRIPVSFSSDGGNYQVSIPNQNLLPPGYYMLFALNSNGVPSTAETIQIGQVSGNLPPVAVASSDVQSGDVPLTVNFTGSGSSDDVGVVSYSWDFGDGSVSSDADPQHTYATAGNYVATLTVTDGGSLTDSDTVPITVNATGGGGCPDALPNDDASLALFQGGGFQGLDSFVGSSVDTNGSPCGLSITNNDAGQPWSNYRIKIDLAAQGITAGDELFISLDGNGGSGVARMEVNLDNSPNSALMAHTYGGGWSTHSETVTVPSGISSLDIWLYSNYNQSGSGGTAHYDNLIVTNLSAGGNLPPVAVASSDVQSGDVPLTVNFTGSGSSDDVGVVSYSWDFGDGSVSSDADPQHTYATAGNYVATLTVTDGGSLTDSDTVPITVNATGGGGCPDALPNDDASLALFQGGGFQGLDSFVGSSVDTNGSPCGLSITNNDAGQPWSNYRIKIDLAAQGITAGDELFISLDGNGGSGVARMEVNLDNSPNSALMAHTYGGGWSTHSETVTVPSGISSLDIWLYSNYNQSGSGGTAHYDNLIVTNLSAGGNLPPVAVASSDVQSGDAPLTVNFTGSGSSDDVGIVSYDWDFGDGNVSSDADPQHTYTVAGNYVATLTVTDGGSLTDSDTVPITVNVTGGGNLPPVAVASSDVQSGDVPLTVNFTGSGSSDDVGVVSYSWDFGDGSVSSDADPQHTYATAGNYVATLTVTDGGSLTDSDTVPITVNATGGGGCPDALPNDDASLALFQGGGFQGLDSFVGSSVDTNGSPCGLSITNNDAGQPWSNYRIKIDLAAQGITAGDELFISLDGNGGSGVARMEVNLDNSPNSALMAHTYGGGWSTHSETVTVPSGISSLDIWLYSNYNQSGSGGTAHYDNLIVTNLSAGGNLPPVAVASSDVQSGDAPLTVNFTGSGSSDDVGIVSYDWDFGDGNVSSDADPQHTYTVAGNYVATLTVTDGGSLTDSDTVPITVNVTGGGNLPPVAVASSDVQSGDVPLTVNFTGSGSSDDVGVVSYSWDFGDGSVSSDADPQHTYATAGNYVATLTVTDGGSLTDSDTVPITVNATGGGGCPDALPNDDASLALFQGGGFQGLDSFVGSSVDTNGSPCGLSITNNDAGQPWSNYRIKIDLAAQGITAGDELFISLDGNGGSGVARMEVNLDNSPNSALMAHTYGGGWSTHSETVTVPSGISSLDIWLYSNYNQSGVGGTAHYDNLVVTNLGNNGNQPPAVDDDDLIVYLNFEESNGTVVSDDSGFTNDFTVIERDDFANSVTANDHTWGSSGVFGNALELDGKFHNSNSILELPYNSVIDDIENEITVTAWVWRDSGSMVPQTGKPANVAVFAHDYPAIFGGFHNWLVKWSFATDNGFVDCYAGHAPLNQWTHFSITYDGQRARLYSNGIEVCDKPITGDISLRNDSTPNSRFTASGFYEHRTDLPVVPYGNQSEITDELDGRLDDFRIYRRALSSQEIRDIYISGLNTGISGIPDCTNLPITAEYKIGASGTWTTGTTIIAPLGSQVFIRASNYNQEYFITTNAYDGPTISSVNDANRLTGEGAYQIDTFVYDFGDPNRNNGVFDIHNVGQYALTTTNGCSTVINLVASGASLQASVLDFEEEIGGEVVLTPNPGNSQVQVYFPEIVKSGSISLFDMNGRLLEIIAEGELLSPIDFHVDNYPDGVYIVVLEYGEKRIRKKLLIRR